MPVGITALGFSNATVTESKGAGTITAMHTFDGGTVDIMTATVIDNDGGTAFVTLNAQPSLNTLMVSQPTISEGGSITLSGTISDPMGSASSDTVTVTWGDGDTTQATVNPSTDTFSATHTYLDNPPGQRNGSYSIMAAASNRLGQSSTAAASVQVNNVAPALTRLKLNTTDINEGSAVTLSGTIADPGVLDSESVSIVWGDGNTTAATVSRSTRAFTATHTYLDNPSGEPNGSYTIVVTASDNAGAQGTASISVEVNNVAPSIAGLAANAGTVAAASPVTVTGTVVDPGVLDSETVSVTWGDGTPSAATVNRTTRVLTATHSYAAGSSGAAADYTITATAMDNSGATAQAQLVIQVNTPASVQNAVVLAAEPLKAIASAASAAITTTTTADPPASSDPAASTPLTSVAMARAQPGQMIALVKSSTIRIPVGSAAQATGSMTRNLMFDEAAGRFVAAQNMTASLSLVTTSMVDDYGEDRLLIGPDGTGTSSSERDIRQH